MTHVDFGPNDMAVIWFIRDQCSDWPPRAKLAYIMLYSRMGADRWVWPSKQRLAADMSMGKDAAIGAIRDLEQMGVLADRQDAYNPETGARETTRFRLMPPWEAKPLSVKQTGPVGKTDRGLSEKPTGAVGESGGGLSEIPTGPCRENRHKVYQDKLTSEAYQQQEEKTAPLGLSTGSVSWRKWYEEKFAGRWPRGDHAATMDNAVDGGMEPEVIIRAIQGALDAGKRDPLSWAAGQVGNWFAAGVRTLAEILQFEQNQAERGPENVRKGDRSGRTQRAAIVSSDTPRSKWESVG